MGILDLACAALRTQEGAADLFPQPVHAGNMVIVAMGEKNNSVGKSI